jgi:hopanoid biosynthesis associated radical SAM protein HpnH
MRFPIDFAMSNAKHMVQQRAKGRKRYPTVLMLEPLYTCNLACLGCAVERHTGKLKDRLPVEKCLEAARVTEVPTVALCGGEPMIYPELPELLEGLFAMGKHVILCTNALLLDKKLFPHVPPNKKLFVNVHLDGLQKTHDYVCNREGVFDKAIEMVKESKERGYLTLTNTTVFKETDVDEVEELCELLTELGVDGILISPGYEFESVEKDIFLRQDQIHEKFRRIRQLAKKYKLTATPTFLDFAAGLIELKCSPWSTVNYTPKGWKGPCYLIGEEFHDDFEDFWNSVDWAYWETRQNRKCLNCKMHSGFEHSAVQAASKSLKGMAQLAAWHVSG